MAEQRKPSPAEMYAEYLVPGIHARWAPVFLDYAKPSPGEHALDVACGTGIVTRHLAPRLGEQGRVAAVDINPDMLRVARELPSPEGAAVEWREGDAAALPDGPFDLVVCQQALQFFDDCEAAAREMVRVLRSSGRATISVWRDLESHPLYQTLLEAEARYLGVPVEEVATPFVFGGADRLRDVLQGAGFSRVEVFEETRPVQFPSPDRFVALTLLAAAAFIPENELGAEARARMVEEIAREVDGTLQQYVDGDKVSFPMYANIATAFA